MRWLTPMECNIIYSLTHGGNIEAIRFLDDWGIERLTKEINQHIIAGTKT